MYLFDTNIILEILLDQAQAENCQKVLETVDEKHEGWMTSFAIHAIAAILSKAKKYDRLEIFLKAWREHPFLHCYDTTLDEEIQVCHLSLKSGLDFDDALQYFVARKKKLKFVTLDRDFRKVRDIFVFSPGEIIKGH